MKKKLANFLHKVLFSCESLTKKDSELSTGYIARLRVKLHFKICKACQRYQQQLRMISDTYKKSLEHQNEQIDPEKLAAMEEGIIKNACKKEN